MTLSTMFTRKLQDLRSFWHSQWWVLKSVLLALSALVISTLASAYWKQLYGLVAPIGAGGSGNGSGWVVQAWSFYQHMGPMDARYIYAVLFLISNFIAWGLRKNPTAFFQIQRLGCNGNHDCLAAEVVLMLFFFTMFLSTVYTTSVHDPRNSWHSKWWVPKIFMLAFYGVLSVFAPTYITQLYGKIAPFGAGLFLIIQLISVIRYITRLTSRWCGQAKFQNHYRKVNTISILAYASSMVGIITMILLYVGCYLNAALVFSKLVLVYGMPLISVLSKAKEFYFEPLLMGAYIVFLCCSAVKSEPESSSCYKKENTGSSVNWITMISFIAELSSVTVAAFSTGTDYKCIQFTNVVVVVSESDVPYGYGFFHFVFATGSMYFGMMFLGWDTHHASEKWSMDVGWTSTIVHLVNEGLTVLFFVAVVLARTYGIGWLEQLLGKIFGTVEQQPAEQPHAKLVQSGTDNSGQPPQEPRATEREGIEMGNTTAQQPPQESRSATEREGANETDDSNNGPPQESEHEETEWTDNDGQPGSSSSSSTTTETLRLRV